MILFFVFTHLPRYFSFSLSYLARLYRCVIMINVANMLNFYGNVLNILVVLERMSTFVLKFYKLKKIPPYKTSFLFLAICILICLPTYFFSTVGSQSQFMRDIFDCNSTSKVVSYCEKTQFSGSLIGQVMIVMVIIIMNGLTTIIEIFVTSISIVYFRRYLKFRGNFLAPKVALNNQENGSKLSQAPARSRHSSINMNLIKLSIYFSTFSSASNFFVFFYNLLVLFLGQENVYYYYLVFGACFLTLLKLILNFFLFYFYNSTFRSNFKSIFNSLIHF
jgi:hypothetical protein